MKQKHRRKWFLVAALLLLLILALDARLKTVFYSIETPKLTEPVRLVVLTDLHSCWYGEEQSTLLNALRRQEPDLVLLVGDIFEEGLSWDNAISTVSSLAADYPCYYVTGNHEYWTGQADYILDLMDSYGITTLSGTWETISINGQTLNLCGIDDPDSGRDTDSALEALTPAFDNDAYTILLSHRPELIDTYLSYPFDLILSGHAHGGQWRIPGLLNGLLAPHQGLFPAYAGGRYDFDEATMIVSRGLARESTLIPRVFNRPELVIVDLTPAAP